ncbi:hypothetical protein CDL12_12490 [Handroanthus impetiginosus]|uniref:PB1 domain-containing protein n=1 Tax=Handroanthus impetiginosus TaxID=429701 RepID=A0A2G9HBG8_9LAMI|nr:hypothetical protein CDL12_12490 [Handroanthus impetiginosus]
MEPVVVKVKYGDMLRRFNAQVVDEELDFNMDGLRKKILSLFSLAPDTELMLTYTDEDDDVVALVDDEDLRDVVRQDLNPLRITVKLNAEKNGRQFNISSGSSTPLRSPQVQQPLQNLNMGISEILRSVPEPLREALVNLSADLASKASSSALGITELVDNLSKASLFYLGRPVEAQPMANSSMQGGVSESSALEDLSNVRSKLSSKNIDNLEKLKPESALENNEVKINSATGGSIVHSSIVDVIATG